jgi:hypothetical protein
MRHHLRPLAALFLLTVPAFAQTSATPTYPQNGQTPNNSGSGAGPIDPMRDTTPKDTCRQLLEKAKSMTRPTSATRADAAEKEMALAVDAHEQGDYAACKMHAEAAMDAKK